MLTFTFSMLALMMAVLLITALVRGKYFGKRASYIGAFRRSNAAWDRSRKMSESK